MIVPYGLLEWIIKIEIIFVILLIIITYLLKYYFNNKAKKIKRISDEIENYLTIAISEDKPINPEQFPKDWRRLDILLQLIYKIDSAIDSPAWITIKKTMAHTLLLPIARKKYNSYFWMNRLLSVQCFEFWMENQDEEKVCRLLEDKIPLVHLHATIAAIRFSSIKLVNLVINIMSKKRRLGQAVYLKVFDIATTQTKEYVEDRLKTENDFFVRATCYKILMTFKEYNTTIDTSADINSSNMELRLAAMRFTSLAQKSEAIPLMISLLSDPEWEVRAASNRILGELHASQAMPEIANSLRDKNWWVRVNAANTLKGFGDTGLQILNSQDPVKDKYAYETAMHVLNKT
jgi:hypothetical protein